MFFAVIHNTASLLFIVLGCIAIVAILILLRRGKPRGRKTEPEILQSRFSQIDTLGTEGPCVVYDVTTKQVVMTYDGLLAIDQNSASALSTYYDKNGLGNKRYGWQPVWFYERGSESYSLTMTIPNNVRHGFYISFHYVRSICVFRYGWSSPSGHQFKSKADSPSGPIRVANKINELVKWCEEYAQMH